jgi:hypothetical protein
MIKTEFIVAGARFSRNLEKETDQDLATLLRQLQYIAEEVGIDLGEN